MDHILNEEEKVKLREAGRIAAIVRREGALKLLKAGTSFLEVMDYCEKRILELGGQIAWAQMGINDVAAHFCPEEDDPTTLKEGDVVKIDLGTYLGGFYGDMARTYPVGKISEETAQLMVATEQSLYEGIKQAVSENHTGDIGYAVQHFIEHRNYSVVRMLVGHGIGRNLHEEPQVPNFGKPGTGSLLKNGIALAIEPMVNAGTHKVNTLSDEWTVVTDDGKLSTHFENTCIVRDGTPEILTLMEGEEIWQKKIQ